MNEARGLVWCSAGHIDPRDRGLAFGDGVFETLLLIGGRPWMLDRHLLRLRTGCERLDLPVAWTEVDSALERATKHAQDFAYAALRLTITRGPGERGYAPPAHTHPTLITQVTPLPPLPESAPAITVSVSNLRLGLQPLLAGIKHLNRLEQVLARIACDREEGVDDALLVDAGGYLIEAIAANLFLRTDDRWLTPRIDQAGVAGTVRAQLLDWGFAEEARLTLVDLQRADAAFLTSSLQPVRCIRKIRFDHDVLELPGSADEEAIFRRLRQTLPVGAVEAD